ncbi:MULTISPECIES: superoxide dismutase family protein [unclassified Roseateles]|uniref:superoxide dismutase family protein n=1 Tax=unclassified Roseateles TaxID=2626991 RepID=UPI0006FF904D|nr:MULTISPECIES: superoxide dismutase family protein [unclassified Roseateles]KQW45373.1 superoxide dismutase [Pelomonas sp. Root405]KRA72217.1 superoxide dismutase [Pelomonas sp. Root662]
MKRLLVAAACLAATPWAISAEINVTLNLAEKQGAGTALGTVRIVETQHGLAFYPALKGLPPGLHGFHVHEKPSCAPAMKDGAMTPAEAAGGHLDPKGSKKHGEPWGDGHLGDLPPLHVAADGSAISPVLGPRLKLADVKNRALMVHAGGDNHSDHPMPLGGGGARVACGVIGS